MQEGEDVIDHAGLFQKCLPCKGTEQKVHPHRQDEDKYDKAVLIDVHTVQNHGERIRKEQTDERTDEGEHKG